MECEYYFIPNRMYLSIFDEWNIEDGSEPVLADDGAIYVEVYNEIYREEAV